ncbi:Calpain-6 [Sparganum proliferum]
MTISEWRKLLDRLGRYVWEIQGTLTWFLPYRSLMKDRTTSEIYAGIFKARFWIDGAWTEVVVDDLLPCLNGKVICPHSSRADEFWPSILVKAYAKLLGGYDRLESVRLEDVLLDFTGCVLDSLCFGPLTSETDLSSVQMFETLTQALAENSLIILCTKPHLGKAQDGIGDGGRSAAAAASSGDQADLLFDELCAPRSLGSIDPETGLCSNFGYLLTKTCLMPRDPSIMGSIVAAFKRAQDCPPRDRLLRLRSLFSASTSSLSYGEWKGAYSDVSKEWQDLTPSDRNRIGLVMSAESEFWMPLLPVLQNFSGALICRLPKTGIFNAWQLSDFHGEWHSVRSGGSLRFRDTFLHNPQYTFELSRDTDEEVLVSLTRKHHWDTVAKTIVHDTSAPPIGFALLKVENNRQVRVHVMSNCKLIYVHEAKVHRAIFGRFTLARGRYVLIPFLEEPLQEAAYTLRIYLPRSVDARELLLDSPAPGPFAVFTGTPIAATRIEIGRASNLTWLKSNVPPSPYCRIDCEGNVVYTSVCTSTSNPVWNETFIFFRLKPYKRPITIDILDKRAVGAAGFLGQHIFQPTGTETAGSLEVDLFCKPSGKEAGARMKGTLSVCLMSVDKANFMNI